MAYYIDVKLHDSTNIGSIVYGKIYSWDSSVISENFLDHLVFEQQSQPAVSKSRVEPHQPICKSTPEQKRYFQVAYFQGGGSLEFGYRLPQISVKHKI
mgnify:CR=1 FL=1